MNGFNTPCLASTVSPSSTVFFLGGSVEYSNLSFSPELADPSSAQFQIQSQALNPYVSIHILYITAALWDSTWSLWNAVNLQRALCADPCPWQVQT